jgi:hypothetical protein
MPTCLLQVHITAAVHLQLADVANSSMSGRCGDTPTTTANTSTGPTRTGPTTAAGQRRLASVLSPSKLCPE